MSVETISLLATLRSLDEIGPLFIADPGATCLVPRRSVRGFCYSLWYNSLEPFSLVSLQRNIQTVLTTARLALASFKAALQDTSEESLRQNETFISLSFDERWQRRFLHVSRLFGDTEPFPSYDKVHRAVAPILIQNISCADIPWEILLYILKNRKLEDRYITPFRQWIGDLQVCPKLISPLLVFSLCEAVAVRAHGTDDRRKISIDAFFLSWRLYQAGISWLNNIDPDFCPYSEQLLPIQFPEDSGIKAHPISGSNDTMAISSSAPLLLGLWAQLLANTPSKIPYLTIHECDVRGRYLIVEKLIGPLCGKIWDGPGCHSQHNRKVGDALSDFCKTLLLTKGTPTLNRNQLFLTITFHICTLSPLETQYSFFSLPYLEQFIHSVCQHDIERIRYVYTACKLTKTLYASMYRRIVAKYACKISNEETLREIQSFQQPRELVSSVASWARSLREIIYAAKRNQEDIVRQVIKLQEELCCFSYVPETFEETLNGRLERQQ